MQYVTTAYVIINAFVLCHKVVTSEVLGPGSVSG